MLNYYSVNKYCAYHDNVISQSLHIYTAISSSKFASFVYIQQLKFSLINLRPNQHYVAVYEKESSIHRYRFALLSVSDIQVFRILDIWNSREICFFLILIIIIYPKFRNGTEKNGTREAINIPLGTKPHDFLKFCASTSTTLLNVAP